MRTLDLFRETKAQAIDIAKSGQTTIGKQIRRHAELRPDHPAVVASGFTPLAYWELQRLIDGVHAALRGAGFTREARIAVAMRNGPQAALAIAAVSCSTVSIPLNPRQTLREIEACLAVLRPDAMLVTKGADSVARRAAERSGITLIEASPSEDGTLGFSIAAPETSIVVTPDEPDEPEAEAPAFILQTSGTSGEPKLIPTSHRNMLAAAGRVQAWFNLTPQDRCLSVSPVFYAHGLHVTVFAPLLSGGTIAFPMDPAKFDFAEWFNALQATWYSAGPTLHRLVFDQIRSGTDARTGHALRFILSGGAPLPRDILQGLQQTLGIPVMEHYGSSECMQICSNLLPPGPSRLGTLGIPCVDTVRIVGDDGRRLPAGERGEVWVGGSTIVSGYLDAPELNRASFVDGWFKSGDIGSLDEDGFLSLHGRKDDLINRGGEKVSLSEVDEALLRHPAVAEAAAFPMPHPRLGEDVATAVVLRSGIKATPLELRDYLQGQLASFKVPRRIVILDQLPKGQTGKVVRRRLAEDLAGKSSTGRMSTTSQSIDDSSLDPDLTVQITEIWEQLLSISPLSPDDDFFENGGDSLLAMKMTLELELLTGRPIPRSILLEASTIRQLSHKLSERGHPRQKSIIRLHPNGSRAPLFYFHGDYNGRGFAAITLARLLGSDQPFLVVAPHGMGCDAIPDTIQAMAADRLSLIIDAQPEGPYRLVGNCLGGMVAFEVARLLVAAGKQVEMVVMLDPPTINARRSVQWLFSAMRYARPVAGPSVEWAMAWTWLRCADVQKFWNISWARRWVAIRKRVQNPIPIGSRDRADQSVVEEFGQYWRRNSERDRQYAYAMSNYFPKPLAVRLVLFSLDYSTKAWRRMSSDFEIVKSRGNHYLPDFADIAERLSARMRV